MSLTNNAFGVFYLPDSYNCHAQVILKLFFLDITDMLEETATESRQATDNESNEEAQWQNGEVIITTN